MSIMNPANPFASGIPTGGIIIWSGTSDNIPDGWALCDGENGTPDLRGRFVLGATTEADEEGNTAHPVGETGGSEEVALTLGQMPAHSHLVNTKSTENKPYTDSFIDVSSQIGKTYSYSAITTGQGSSESHPNMPPYYVLAYIMKL